jgi:hypothetical protein
LGRQDLAPDVPINLFANKQIETGCYGICGPVPYAVLDKKYNLKRTNKF